MSTYIPVGYRDVGSPERIRGMPSEWEGATFQTCLSQIKVLVFYNVFALQTDFSLQNRDLAIR